MEHAKALRRARGALAEAWLFPEGLALAAREVAGLIPGHAGAIYFRESDGRFAEIGHDTPGRLAFAWDEWPEPMTLARIQPYIAYRLRGRDPTEGRFVPSSDIHRDDHGTSAYHAILASNGFTDSMRTVIYRRGRMRVWCGVFRPHGERPPSREAIARLSRIVPALRDSVRAADVTRYGRAEPAALQVLFESIDQPIWLLTKRGTIAYANTHARALGRDPGSAARAAAGRADPRFAVSRVTISGDALHLVIGRVGTLRSDLPPSLARVADGIARGLTDKQIADDLEVPISTVRTYVRRCYERLGVHNRVELAVALGRARRS